MICSLSIVSLFLLKGTLFNFTLSLHKPKTMVQLHQQASRSDLQGLPIKPIFYVKEHQSVKTIMFQLSSSSWVLCAQFLPVSLVPQESSTIILFFQPSRLCLLFFSVHFWRIMWNRLNGCSGSSNVAYYTFIWCLSGIYINSSMVSSSTYPSQIHSISREDIQCCISFPTPHSYKEKIQSIDIKENLKISHQKVSSSTKQRLQTSTSRAINGWAGFHVKAQGNPIKLNKTHFKEIYHLKLLCLCNSK